MTAATHARHAAVHTGSQVFFVAAAVYAAAAVAAWAAWFLGVRFVPSPLPASAWHLHSLLFGFVPAVMAGVLLPLPSARPARWSLAALLALWLAGRIVVSIPLHSSVLPIAGLDMAFALVLTGMAASEAAVRRTRRYLFALPGLAGLLAAQALLHWEVARFGRVELADRLGLGVVVLVITIMLAAGRMAGHRSRWLRGAAATMGAIALAAWFGNALSLVPGWLAGALLLAAGSLHLTALFCVPPGASSRPLAALLRAVDLLVASGFLLTGIAAMLGMAEAANAGVRAWSIGAIGTMSLALMNGCGRQRLRTGTCMVLVYSTASLAAGLFIAAALAPRHTMVLMPVATVCWMTAFLGAALAQAALPFASTAPLPTR